MNKLKKSKPFLIAIIVIFTVVACEKDLYEDVINQDKQINIKQISLEKFNSKMRQMINKPEIERFMVSSINNSALSRSESTSGFEIITDDIKEINQGDYTSYTMYVKTSDTTKNIYNITIEEINDYSTFFITKYIPTTYWLENKDQPYDGEIITFRESNTNSDGAVSLQEYMELIGDDLYTAGGGGGNPTSGFGNNLGPSTIYPSDCNGEVHTTVVVEALMCSENRHWLWSPEVCTADRKARISTRTYYECIPTIGGNPYGSSNTSGPGNTTGGNTLGGGGSGSGSGTSSGTSTGTTTGSITTIVSPIEEEKKTPCEQLKIMALNFNFKNALFDLQTKTNETMEYGYGITKSNSNYNNPVPNNSDPNNPNLIVMTAGSNNIGCFHTHPNPVETGIYPMFSAGDIKYLLDIALLHDNNGLPKDYSEYFITLTVGSGTYALKIKDFRAFRNKMTLFFEGPGGFKERLENGNYDYREPSGDIDLLKKDFLKVVRGLGIGLYEASNDLSSWTEVVLDLNPVSPTFSEPKNIPCN